MNVLETLISARVLILNPNNWTQHVMARDAEGYRKNAQDNYACQFCSLGAIARMGGVDFISDGGEAVKGAVDALQSAMGMPVARFNDNHTHKEVMAAWDNAIESLEKKNERT